MIASNRVMTFPFFRTAYPWILCSIAMLFYCYNYLLRSSPNVMQADLSQAYHITAYQFGILTSAYYWAYTPMQIPAGMIYDKFGVRFVLSLASIISTIGASVFINADSFTMAWIGRFLIGLGCSFAYIGVLKLASIWLPANRFAMVAGLATAAGMSCGALTQKYMAHFVETVGYKQALHPSIFIGIALSIVFFLLLKDKPKNTINARNEMQTPLNTKQLFQSLRIIFNNPQMWLVGAIGCLLYLPASVFLDAYSKQFLLTVYHITAKQAANASILTFIGWIVSGPLIGAYSDAIKRRCLPLTISGFFASVLLCVVFYFPSMVNLWGLYAIFFFIGFCCGAHPLCFPLGKENNPIQISGTAVAATNMLIMLGGNIFPPIVGKLLDLHSSAVSATGLPIYTASDYTFALSVVPVGVALGIFLSIFLKETYCQSRKIEQREESIFEAAPLELELELETETAK